VLDSGVSIPPALTPEEWGRYTDPAWTSDISTPGAIASIYESHDFAALIAWLNHQLPNDDPRKITREDVAACLAAGPRTWNDPIAGEPPEALARLAAKLAALLPPE